MSATFPKTEKLCGQRTIESLYRTGKRFTVWPLRVTYLPSDAPTRVLVWAPKSSFRHAVERNLLRRRMREAYRLQKPVLEAGGKSYCIAFNYADRAIQSSAAIHKAMRKALTRLAGTSAL